MLEEYLKKTEPEYYPPVEKLLDLIYEHYTENNPVEKNTDAGKAAKAKEKELDQQLAAITKAVPQEGKRIAIIHATPSAVSVELPTSIAGDIAKILHLQNVADGTPGGKDATRIPYSMESLVQADPDVIFFTSMGSSDKIEKRIKDDVESNPAWASLTAVKEGRVYVLPENYFLLNPGLDYPQAVAYMANLVYPEDVHE